MNLNCLIIEDEPLSQDILKKFISNVDFLNLVGISQNASDALNFLSENNKIHLIFLDINMPKISGLTFYKSLIDPPNVIFTTAYPQYAIDGFELNAVDYLLKPFSFERFLTAVNKVVKKVSLLENKASEVDNYILIKSDKTLHKVFISDIYYLEAFGDYVKVYIEKKYLLTYSTLTKMQELLFDKGFIQTHKSYVVNLNKINAITGNYIVIEEHKVPIGQKHKSNFFNSVKKD